MNKNINKPFYKKLSFIICATICLIFFAGLVTSIVFLATRYNIYKDAINAFNSAYNEAVAKGATTFQVMFNGQELGYWTTSAKSAGIAPTIYQGGVDYFYSTTFYVADYHGALDASDNEIWVYLTRTLIGKIPAETLITFVNIEGKQENLSFLIPAVLGSDVTKMGTEWWVLPNNVVNINVTLIAMSIVCSVVTFVSLVPVLFMSLSKKFANKKSKKEKLNVQANIQ